MWKKARINLIHTLMSSSFFFYFILLSLKIRRIMNCNYCAHELMRNFYKRQRQTSITIWMIRSLLKLYFFNVAILTIILSMSNMSDKCNEKEIDLHVLVWLGFLPQAFDLPHQRLFVCSEKPIALFWRHFPLIGLLVLVEDSTRLLKVLRYLLKVLRHCWRFINASWRFRYACWRFHDACWRCFNASWRFCDTCWRFCDTCWRF